MTEVLINCQTLTKSYSLGLGKKKTVLKDISFQMFSGERIGIIGENGAGKSTLLRILSGHTMHSSGQLDVNGEVHAALSVGVGVREELTGRHCLNLEVELLNLSEEIRAQKVQEMIDFADLAEFIDRPVRTYSSGMKSRLMFSGLLSIDPEILLIDETLSTGDQFFKEKAKNAIRALCEKGNLVVIVSHSLPALCEMTTRCIWLKDGKIELDGPTHEVAEAYQQWQESRVDQFSQSVVAASEKWTKDNTIEISELEVFQSKSVMSAIDGFPNVMECKLSLPESGDYKVSFEIRRLDGLLLTKQQMPVSEYEKFRMKTSGIVKVQFPELHLGSGVYEFILNVEEGSTLIAMSKKAIMLNSDKSFIGGRPLLINESFAKVS